MKRPTVGEMLFSFKSFVAAMLAFYCALMIGLPRPFWAPMTAYVIAQPLAGAVRSKAIYRVIGTILGSAVAVILVPPLVNYSLLLMLALSLWVGICLYFSLLDRSPRSYVFILSGYTAAFISFPSLVDTSIFNVATMFDIALARVEEITIGIVSATLVHSLFFPQSIGAVVIKRMEGAIEDAQNWISHALLGDSHAQNTTDYRKLAQDISELRLMSTHLPFDTSNLRWTANAIRILQDKLAALIPLLSALEDRVAILRSADKLSLRPQWQVLLADINAWVRKGVEASPERAMQLRHNISNIRPIISSKSSWEDVLQLNLAAILGGLIDTCEDCFGLRRQINKGLASTSLENEQRLLKIPTREMHADRRLALMSAFAAVVAISVSCTFWIVTGWTVGFCAPMLAAVYCTFFAAQDDPVPTLKLVLYYTIYSIPLGAVYLLLLLPSAHSFEMLVLVFSPFLLVAGVFMARPANYLRATTLVVTTFASLAMIDTTGFDMTSFINSQVSQLAGVASAVIFTKLFRSVSSEWTARRLLHAGWDEIARLGLALTPPPLIVITVRMIDRIGLLAPRLAAVDKREELTATNALDDLRVGLNMSRLMGARTHLLDESSSIQTLLTSLAEHFMNRSVDPLAREATLLIKIDHALQQVCKATTSIYQSEAISALAGIRRDLFPVASPYQYQGAQGQTELAP